MAERRSARNFRYGEFFSFEILCSVSFFEMLPLFVISCENGEIGSLWRGLLLTVAIFCGDMSSLLIILNAMARTW